MVSDISLKGNASVCGERGSERERKREKEKEREIEKERYTDKQCVRERGGERKGLVL